MHLWTQRSVRLSLSLSRSLSLGLSLSEMLVAVQTSDMRTQRVEAFGLPTALSEAEWERGPRVSESNQPCKIDTFSALDFVRHCST